MKNVITYRIDKPMYIIYVDGNDNLYCDNYLLAWQTYKLLSAHYGKIATVDFVDGNTGEIISSSSDEE